MTVYQVSYRSRVGTNTLVVKVVVETPLMRANLDNGVENTSSAYWRLTHTTEVVSFLIDFHTHSELFLFPRRIRLYL